MPVRENGRRAKRLKIPRFLKIYFVCILAAVVALTIGVSIINGILADYEAVQPKYLAEEIYNDFFAARNFTGLLETADCAISRFESKEKVADYLSNLSEGKSLTYTSVSSGIEGDVKYTVQADDMKLTTFTLAKSDQKSKKGFRRYQLKAIEIHGDFNGKVSVKAPSDTTVFLNGIELPDEYLIQQNIPEDSGRYLPEGVSGIPYKRYAVEGLLAVPLVTAADKNGKETLVTYSETEKLYIAALRSDDALQEKYGAFVLAAIEKYAAYTVNDAGISSLYSYFDTKSTLFKRLERSEAPKVASSHNGYSFKDEKTGDFYAYTDDIFSCSVSFTHILMRGGTENYRDHTDVTVFLRNVDGRFVIYEFHHN
ncbi:MAG: hypothetical protein LBQ48_08230 [Oscillospiraceae bacterium]|jgi:hypothetical protein|nr:hypothetical protein [Oscillospiraceae bacterium]